MENWVVRESPSLRAAIKCATSPRNFSSLRRASSARFAPFEIMDVKLPNLGEGADSGTVVGIMVKPGAQIKKGQNIIELETGKAVSPIPAPAAGTVTAIRVKE